MITIWFVVERFSEIATLALIMFFLYRCLKPRLGKHMQLLAATLYIFTGLGYYYLNLGYRPYFAVFLGLIYTHFVFEGRFRTHIIWTILAVVIEGVTDTAVVSAYLLFTDAVYADTGTPGVSRMIVTIAAKLLLFLAYYIATAKVEKSNEIRWRNWFLLLLVPVGCWIMLEIIFSYSDAFPETTALPLMAAGSAALSLIVISILMLYNQIIADEKELARSKLQLYMAKTTKDHLDQVNDIYNQLSSVRHDLRNHFTAIAGYTSAKDYEALDRYVSEFISLDASMLEYCNHPVLNALISIKSSMAKKSGIDFTTNISLPDVLPLSDVDLCIMISNILDNAFEANEAALEKRFIHLNAQVVNSYWVVACRNSVGKKENFRSSGNLKSSKSTSDIRGIGTRQIRDIAEKTGGFVTYRHEGHEFRTVVMVRLPERKDSLYA